MFVGGFTLDAAEGVIDLAPWPQAPVVIDVVQSLVERSLLRVMSPGAGPRLEIDELHFGMYVSIQDYAAEKLREAEDAATAPADGTAKASADQRHGRYFAGFGSVAAIRALTESGGAARTRALTRDIDNLVAACRRAIARADAPVAAGSFVATGVVLAQSGPFRLGTQLGRQVLALDGLTPADRGRTANQMAIALRLCGESDESMRHFEMALALRRETGDRHAQSQSLYGLASLHSIVGHRDESLRYLQESLSVAREAGNGGIEVISLDMLANVASNDGRMDDALRLYSDALAVSRQHGIRSHEGHVLCNLGIYHSLLGHDDEALACFTDAIAIAREWGNRRNEGHVLGDRGAVFLRQDRLAEASADLQAALLIALDTGNGRFEVNVRHRLGDLCLRQGEPDAALDQFERGLVRARESGYRAGEGRMLARLGHVRTACRELELARQAFAEAETVFLELNERWDIAALHCYRGECERVAGDLAAARLQLAAAAELATALGAGPESELGRNVAKLRAAVGDAGLTPGA